jgi:hypothetical protein
MNSMVFYTIIRLGEENITQRGRVPFTPTPASLSRGRELKEGRTFRLRGILPVVKGGNKPAAPLGGIILWKRFPRGAKKWYDFFQ